MSEKSQKREREREIERRKRTGVRAGAIIIEASHTFLVSRNPEWLASTFSSNKNITKKKVEKKIERQYLWVLNE